jgi:hypothetical protein
MKRSIPMFGGLIVAMLACSPSQRAVETAMAQTLAARPTDTPPPVPTSTPMPTATAAPTRTPAPTFEPAPHIDAAVVEAALREAGYGRYPFIVSDTGEDAYYWDNGSGIVFYTYSSGFEMAFLNDSRHLNVRIDLIDQAIQIVSPLFAQGFISALQEEAHGYTGRVPGPTGEPTILDYGQDPWLGELLEFNGYEATIRNGSQELYVYVRLLYREYLCDMSRYSYCYFTDMPSMTFTDGASLTTLHIWIAYP